MLAQKVLEHFHPDVRADVALYIGRDAKLLVVARNCPVVIIALTYQQGSTAQLAAAEAAALDGNGSLALRAFGLPQWTADLDASAFGKDLSTLPGGPDIDEPLAASIPDKKQDHRHYFNSIQAMMRHGDAAACVWLAQAMKSAKIFVPDAQVALLAFYIICSRATGSPAARMMQVPWRDDMFLATAARHAQSWIGWMIVTARLGGLDLADIWRQGCTVDGHTFGPVVNARQCADIAIGLDNCCFQIASSIEDNAVRYYAVFFEGSLKGLAEIRLGNDGMLQCVQLKGYKNQRPDRAMINATHQFLSRSIDVGVGGPVKAFAEAPAKAVAQTWSALSAPYFAAKGVNPHVPQVGNAANLKKLRDRAGQFERLARMNFLHEILGR